MGKPEFRVMIKYCFLVEKFPFKLGDCLKSVIRALHRQTQPFAGGMLILNAVGRTDINDTERSGSLNEAVTPQNKTKTLKIVVGNGKVKLYEIAEDITF